MLAGSERTTLFHEQPGSILGASLRRGGARQADRCARRRVACSASCAVEGGMPGGSARGGGSAFARHSFHSQQLEDLADRQTEKRAV